MAPYVPDPAPPSPGRIVHQFYVPFQLPDPATPTGKSVARRLREEPFVWLTTVDGEGVPQPLPVSFLWDETHATFLTYSLPESERGRLAHIQQNPRVALHFEGDGERDYIVITGEAAVSPDDPPADQVPAWVEKYQEVYPRLLGIPLKQAGASATIPLRIRPLTLRYVPNPRGTPPDQSIENSDQPAR